ncbi:MAG TPA: hypothetical protein PL185_13080, partial [Flavobacteriales bacterium]|nr:hypothetical protein [Flavobacteriales bacterium]
FKQLSAIYWRNTNPFGAFVYVLIRLINNKKAQLINWAFFISILLFKRERAYMHNKSFIKGKILL